MAREMEAKTFIKRGTKGVGSTKGIPEISRISSNMANSRVWVAIVHCVANIAIQRPLVAHTCLMIRAG
jgi:hypothetical protein